MATVGPVPISLIMAIFNIIEPKDSITNISYGSQYEIVYYFNSLGGQLTVNLQSIEEYLFWIVQNF